MSMTKTDKQALRQTAEKAQEHGVFNMDIHSGTVLALLDELEAAEKRIAELEQSHAQVIHARDHYKRVASEGIQSLAEARALTVKLPQGYVIRPGHPMSESERGVMIPKDDGEWLSRIDVEIVLHTAGIALDTGE